MCPVSGAANEIDSVMAVFRSVSNTSSLLLLSSEDSTAHLERGKRLRDTSGSNDMTLFILTCSCILYCVLGNRQFQL